MTDIRSVERFLFHEARLLDEARFDDWLGLFTETAWYWVPVEPNQENPLETVSIIYDDRRLLETRVRRLTNPNIHAQSPPSRTSRMIGNIMIDSDNGTVEDAELIVSSRFQMTEFRSNSQRQFAGALTHGLMTQEHDFRIAWKRVDLVNCDGMIEGITVPF
jgi:3-phenylpropionate/cinnamic acid dioxygenase small subunit